MLAGFCNEFIFIFSRSSKKTLEQYQRYHWKKTGSNFRDCNARLHSTFFLVLHDFTNLKKIEKPFKNLPLLNKKVLPQSRDATLSATKKLKNENKKVV